MAIQWASYDSASLASCLPEKARGGEGGGLEMPSIYKRIRQGGGRVGRSFRFGRGVVETGRAQRALERAARGRDGRAIYRA